jgi:hypothetical protein
MLSRIGGPLGGGGGTFAHSVRTIGTTPMTPRSPSALGYGQQVKPNAAGSEKTISIAFVTTGDSKLTPVWKEYAKKMVAPEGGRVHMVARVAQAMEIVKAITGVKIGTVYFVGHGVAAAESGAPAFFWHGHHEGGRFIATKSEELLTAKHGAFWKALAPKLTTRKEVLVAFLACYCGTDSVLQKGVAEALVRYEAAARVRVEGYASYYEVNLDNGKDARLTDGKSRAHTAPVRPPDRPGSDTEPALRSGTRAEKDGTFDDLNSRDPIQGLF